MKKRPKKIKQKVVKGTSRAILLSILIHAGLFVLAGVLVIFTVLPKPPVEFEPPPQVQVPKMPLKKLKVRTKKPSKPKSTAKLTAVVKKVDISQIAFPDLPTSGIGPGIGTGGGGSGGFVDLPDLDDVDGILGKKDPTGVELVGTYYDMKRNRDGSYNGTGDDGITSRAASEGGALFNAAVNNFFARGWSTTALDDFYRSPKKRHASCIVVPTMSSSFAPAAFGEDRGSGIYWMVHYKGQIVYPEDITFRFWGAADNFLGVRVNRKMVFFTAWQSERDDYVSVKWKSSSSQRHSYFWGYDTLLDVGDWITLKANEPVDIEIALGDNGGLAALGLMVEVKGVDYPQNDQGGPILPVFKTEVLSHDMLDMIYKDLYEDDCSLTNGPVFNDFTL